MPAPSISSIPGLAGSVGLPARPFTPGYDFLQVVDGLEPVTIYRRVSAVSIAVPHAKRLAISLAERNASNGKYTRRDVTWMIHRSELEDIELGDRITDAYGVVWVVQEIEEEPYLTAWTLPSRILAIAAGLDQLVTIERLTWIKGASNQAKPKWLVWKTAVPAKLQISESNPTTENGQRYVRKSGQVFFAEQFDLDFEEFRIVCGGEVYSLTGDEDRDSISGLYTVNVVSHPWPLG